MASARDGNGGTAPGFWERIGDSVASGFGTLSDVYVQREIYQAFPEGVTTSTRPTTLDYGVTEQAPQVPPTNNSRLQGVDNRMMNGQTMGVNNSTIIMAALGIVGLVILARS